MHPALLQNPVYDWNAIGARTARRLTRVRVLDETLRDGLQSASVRDPSIAEKRDILRLLDRLGVHAADLGLPAAGERARRDVTALCETIRDEGMQLTPSVAARTLRRDVEPILAIAAETGVRPEVLTFLGASPIRTWAENWTLPEMSARVREAVSTGVRGGLPVGFVTEDTVRASPNVLEELYRTALGEGASRVVLCDTVGHATPEGVFALVDWTRNLLARINQPQVEIDFHGHNDRGLALWNAIVALKAGATRIHATVLGIGERVGNCPLDQLLVNLSLSGFWDEDLTPLDALCKTVARAVGREIPVNYPVVGEDAFRTVTGVHAAAIVKALARGGTWAADRMYSGVPSSLVGRTQVIEVGPLSGDSNILAWLARHGLGTHPMLVAAIRARAKASDRTLADAELAGVVDAWAASRSASNAE